MRIKYLLLVLILVLTISPKSSAEEQASKTSLPTASSYSWVKVKEFLSLNLSTYKKTSKASVLDGFTQKRMEELNYAYSVANNDAMDQILSRYENQRNLSYNYAKNANDEALLNKVRERTLEQQRTMTKLQLTLENAELQGNIVKIQKNVATNMENTILNTQGESEANVAKQEIEQVWYAPGTTASGPPAGWTYAPGTSGEKYAPGTSGTGASIDNAQRVYAPGTSSTGDATNSTSSQVIEGNSTGDATNQTSGQVIEGNQSGPSGQTVEGNQSEIQGN